MTYVFSINHIHGRVMPFLLANHVHCEISGICYPNETSAFLFECRVFIQLHDIITHLILSYRYLSGNVTAVDRIFHLQTLECYQCNEHSYDDWNWWGECWAYFTVYSMQGEEDVSTYNLIAIIIRIRETMNFTP